MEREIKAFFYLFFIVRVTVKNQKGDTMNPQYKKLESETDYEYGLRLKKSLMIWTGKILSSF